MDPHTHTNTQRHTRTSHTSSQELKLQSSAGRCYRLAPTETNTRRAAPSPPDRPTHSCCIEKGHLTKGTNSDLQQLDRTRSHIPQRKEEPDSRKEGKERSDCIPLLKHNPLDRGTDGCVWQLRGDRGKMLAKILEDMWVEPEVLEALNEEQKRILFLKMREEQVRRWRAQVEKEEREERERGGNNSRPKKASSKHVQWLLGRDGDVSVIVIGEVDEFRSSKLLQSLRNNRLYNDDMNGIQTVNLLSGREARELGFKEETQMPLADVSDYPASPNEHASEEDVESCSADDDLKDPAEDSDSESGSSSDNPSDCYPLYRPYVSHHGNQPPLKAGLSDTERADPQDRGIGCLEEKQSDNRGRVAQLRKAFTDDRHSTTPAYSKPPIPCKPAHLQMRSTPLIH